MSNANTVPGHVSDTEDSDGSSDDDYDSLLRYFAPNRRPIENVAREHTDSESAATDESDSESSIDVSNRSSSPDINNEGIDETFMPDTDDDSDSDIRGASPVAQLVATTRPRRTTRPPSYLEDYVVNKDD